MSKYYVYYLYEIGQANPFYVGKGSGRRAWNHTCPSELKRPDKVHRKIQQILDAGNEIEVHIPFDSLTESEAFAREIERVAFFGLLKDGGCLYNLTNGGEGGCRFVSEKARLSFINRMKGNKFRQGHADLKRKPIASYLFGNKIKSYPSMYHAKLDGFNDSRIRKVLNSKTRTAFGFEWKTEGQAVEPIQKPKSDYAQPLAMSTDSSDIILDRVS